MVIAVNLNSDLLTKNRNPRAEQKKKPSEIYKLVQKAKKLIPAKYQKETLQNDMPEPPDFFETIASSINIAQDRITKTRLAGDPPEVTLQPKLSRIGLLETYRAEEAIAEGRRCCELAFPQIRDALDLVQVEEGEKSVGGSDRPNFYLSLWLASRYKIPTRTAPPTIFPNVTGTKLLIKKSLQPTASALASPALTKAI